MCALCIVFAFSLLKSKSVKGGKERIGFQEIFQHILESKKGAFDKKNNMHQRTCHMCILERDEKLPKARAPPQWLFFNAPFAGKIS